MVWCHETVRCGATVGMYKYFLRFGLLGTFQRQVRWGIPYVLVCWKVWIRPRPCGAVVRPALLFPFLKPILVIVSDSYR